MIPKIGAALSRFLEPLKPVPRPGESLTARKSSEGGEGGHGNLPAEKWKQDSGSGPESEKKEKEEEKPPLEAAISPRLKAAPKDGHSPADSPDEQDPVHEAVNTVHAQAGLTQVILDMNGTLKEAPAGGSGIESYESGSREQKSGTRLPKGAMLDKKVG